MQASIFWQLEIVTFVPTGTIENHDDVFIGVTQGNLVEENPHAPAADFWQNQGIHTSVLGRYGRIGIRV